MTDFDSAAAAEGDAAVAVPWGAAEAGAGIAPSVDGEWSRPKEGSWSSTPLGHGHLSSH